MLAVLVLGVGVFCTRRREREFRTDDDPEVGSGRGARRERRGADRGAPEREREQADRGLSSSWHRVSPFTAGTLVS